MPPSSLEERLAHVELELAQLKSQLKTRQPREDWLAGMIGLFKDDVEFQEILRLGKLQRDADRPAPE